MNHYDTAIIGGGIFGAVIAENLRRQGHRIIVLDSSEKGAGSKPAACLMKPGWFAGLGKDVYNPSLELLDRLYGIEDLQFTVYPTRAFATVHWVRPTKILMPQEAAVTLKVDRIIRSTNGWEVRVESGAYYRVRNVVLAAGVWCNEILVRSGLAPIKGLTGRWGNAFLWRRRFLQPFISPWAPYRQVVGFLRAENEVWVGDGTAVKLESLDCERGQQSLERCAKYAKLPAQDVVSTLAGARPYVPNAKPALLEELEKGLWIATGGAKNGTLAAGWCAHVLGEKL